MHWFLEQENIDIRLLIQGCKKDDPYAQKRVFQLFFAYAMSVALRYNSSKENAQEVVNDSFLKVFAKIDQYDSSFPFKAWLSRIVINSSIDLYRKLSSNVSMEEIQDHHLDESKDMVSNFFFEDDGSKVLPLIQELPPQYRMVFNLYVFEEYKHHEIADKLGIAVGTSKSNLSRAKIILIEKINNDPKYIRFKSSSYG